MAEEKSGVPARQSLPLDRQAVERVLARAAELQGGVTGSDSSDLITEAQILEIGKEVGLTPAILNQALAEERTRVHVPEERGFFAQLAGGSFASATRTIAGNQRAILAEIDGWMQRQECLSVQRRFTDRITWEPQRGILATIKRGMNAGGRGYHLMRASQVSGTVLPVDENRVVVRLDADLGATRKTRLEAGALLGGTGLVGAAGLGFALTVASVPFILVAAVGALPIIAGGMAGYYVVGAHRNLLSSAQLALEQILDRLEHREMSRGESLLSSFVPGGLLRR
jgi:hypothetical protein